MTGKLIAALAMFACIPAGAWSTGWAMHVVHWNSWMQLPILVTGVTFWGVIATILFTYANEPEKGE